MARDSFYNHAGDYRHVVSILRPVQAGSPPVQSWSTPASILYGKVRADIAAQFGTEAPSGSLAPPNVATFEISCYYRKGVRPKMRVTWQDGSEGQLRTFEIDDVVDVGMRRRKLSMICREVRS